MSFENLDTETLALSHHPQFLAILECSRKRQQQEGGLSSAALRERLKQKAKQPIKRKARHDE